MADEAKKNRHKSRRERHEKEENKATEKKKEHEDGKGNDEHDFSLNLPETKKHSNDKAGKLPSTPKTPSNESRDSKTSRATIPQASPGAHLDEKAIEKLVSDYKMARGGALTFVSRKDQVVKKLGEGSYAVVYLVKTADGKEMAAKVIDTEKTSEHYRSVSLRREIKILGKLIHPHIINTYIILGMGKTVTIFMEYSNGGSLGDLLRERGAIPEHPDASVMFWKISSAVEYMHVQKNTVHRDLKLENILLHNKTEPKLTDFSYAKTFRREETPLSKTFCGSPIYLPPEMLLVLLGKIEPPGKLENYNPFKADIWSLAVCLTMMLLRAIPYKVYEEGDSSTVKQMLKQQMAKKWLLTKQQEEKVSKDCLDLLRKMLEPNVNERYDIIKIRNHPWLKHLREQQNSIDLAAAKGAP
ncbi:Testis-specific serine/threonine-protein kinase 1 [Halotydeus destructor]|nr:Testis-specific serine/threonine-protein kinase 1 [Halotydeus destructor]